MLQDNIHTVDERHSQIQVYRYVPPREANWLLIQQSRVQRKRGLFDQSHAALKTLHDNCSTFSPNKQLDPQMLHAQIKEHVRLAMVTGHTQQALTLLSSSGNLDSLSNVNRADLYRLKGAAADRPSSVQRGPASVQPVCLPLPLPF
jgi:hypothetical protein